MDLRAPHFSGTAFRPTAYGFEWRTPSTAWMRARMYDCYVGPRLKKVEKLLGEVPEKDVRSLYWALETNGGFVEMLEEVLK